MHIHACKKRGGASSPDTTLLANLLESKEVTTLERGDSVMARVGPRLKADGAGLTLHVIKFMSRRNLICII